MTFKKLTFEPGDYVYVETFRYVQHPPVDIYIYIEKSRQLYD